MKTKKSLKKYTEKKGRAYYDAKENIIHINLDKARVTTVPHEIFHSVLISKLETEPAIAKAAITMMKAVRKSLPKNSAIVSKN
jgi:hypothetical protein